MKPANVIHFSPDFASPADWAAMYRACGLQVVPSHSPTHSSSWKIPALKAWKEFQDNLTPEATFQRWYAPGGEFATHWNMGVLTGRASGNLMIIDLDEYKTPDAAAWWRGVLEQHNHGLEPETAQQITGGGGRQILFRCPDDYKVPTNRTPIGVDIRGQGGFAVLPPSMHLSGTAYSWREGYEPWECGIEDAPAWLCEAVSRLVEQHGGDQTRQAPPERTASPESDYNEFGTRVDGRESEMRGQVWRAVVGMHRDCPIQPSEAESAARMHDAYTAYEATVGSRVPGPGSLTDRLEREGRGLSEFAKKWRYAMGQWGTDVALASREKLEPDAPITKSVAEVVAAQQGQTGDIYETLDLAAIDALPPPTWLVDGVIPEGGLTFIYGKPGKGKSFITLDLALRVAHGIDWHGKECKQGGVLYIAGEGKGGYRNRVRGWHHEHGIVPDCAPFRLLPRALNFMTPDDVAKLVRTIKSVVGDARLVIIDTVARVLPGAEENASKEMGLFVAACDAIRDACGVAVIGVHHSGKDEERGMRGSTALEGAGDCVLHLKRGEDSAFVDVITEKQKDGEEAKPLRLEFKKVEWMDGLKQASTLVPISAATTTRVSPLDKATCRKILAEIKRAWDAGEPWSNSPQTRKEGRYLPRWMVRETGCTRAEAEFLIEEWMMNKVLSVEIYSLKHKLRGIKLIGGID